MYLFIYFRFSFSYLFYFFIFIFFTILYWFCHTSTWICCRCTQVPTPEPPSHLPPHTIPLGHPSAPAPSILYPASNLDWWFISYMRLYMFQWYIYTMEYYSAIKKNTFESVLMSWMKLELIIQSELSQEEKHQYSILTQIYGI